MKTLILLIFLGACSSSLTVYDKEVCVDLDKDGAHCHNTYVSKSRDIPKPQWDIERVGQLCMGPTAYSDTEKALDEVCVKLKCTYEQHQILEQIKMNMRDLSVIAKMAREKAGLPIKEFPIDTD